MNNRYICRGKGNPKYNGGEWYYGYLTYDGSDYQIVDPEYGSCKRTVIPETVGKCANLKDKNGKLIYEGDLLRFTNSDNEQSIYKVFYDDVYAGYRIQEIGLGGLDEMSNWEDSREYFEVIGNIHDNPELLEVER